MHSHAYILGDVQISYFYGVDIIVAKSLFGYS